MILDVLKSRDDRAGYLGFSGSPACLMFQPLEDVMVFIGLEIQLLVIV